MKDSDAKRLSTQLGTSYIHALRLVRLARQLAGEREITYPEAEQCILSDRSTHPGPAARSLAQELLGAVEAECMGMAYREVEYGIDKRPKGGLPFGDVPLPRGAVEDIAVESVDPDLDTLVWSIDEEYDGSTQIANVELTANVTFDGYVKKSAAHNNKDISVVEFDWSEHMSRVSFTRRAILMFHAVLQPHLPAVDNLEFIGASDVGTLLPNTGCSG